MISDELDYSPLTGEFKWKKKKRGRSERVGTVVRNRNKSYIAIRVLGKIVQAHRLAFLFVTGEMPDKRMEVDHIDGNGLNNKFENLRLVTPSENQRNASLRKDNLCGFTGVRFIRPKRGSPPYWHARIKVNRKDISLGCYQSLIDAVAARIRANRKYGFTDRHGR